MNEIARNLQDLYAFYGKLRLNYINKNETFILIYTEQKNERIYRHEEMNGLRKTTLKTSLIGAKCSDIRKNKRNNKTQVQVQLLCRICSSSLYENAYVYNVYQRCLCFISVQTIISFERYSFLHWMKWFELREYKWN